MVEYEVTHVTPKGYISAIAVDGRTINGVGNVSRETICVGDIICFRYKAQSGVNVLRKVLGGDKAK